MNNRNGGELSSVPWNYQESWAGFLFFIVLTIGFYLAAIWAYWQFDLSLSWEIWLLISEFVFIFPVWWLALHRHHVGLNDLGFRRFDKINIGIGCGLVFVVNIFTAVYSVLIEYFFDSPLQPDLGPVADEMVIPWLLFIVVVIIAPVVEEVFFRGFLFAGLIHRYGWLKAALFSSFVFSIIHFQIYAILPLFLLGFVFAFLYYRSHSIWPCIIMHFLVNLMAVIAEFSDFE